VTFAVTEDRFEPQPEPARELVITTSRVQWNYTNNLNYRSLYTDHLNTTVHLTSQRPK